VLVAAVAFGERLTPVAIGGGVLILCGAAAVVTATPKPLVESS
jgi:drug/metabolite transporter (DMT)-like permease